MSYTCKRKANRFLRKYTASVDSPVYAAAIDAQTVALSLCDVPWQAVSVEDAGLTNHNADGLDANVTNRDAFDAALFCAGHGNGKHRAYAQAAVYRITIPDSAVGVTLESLSVVAASDPYNAAGLRLHVFTNSTGEIPTNCHTVRGEDASGEIIADGTTASGAVPRTSDSSSGTEYWYAASGTVTITPTGGLALGKYLFLLVALENYNASRGNWLEGCGFVRNAITLQTSAEIDWSEVDAAIEEPSASITVVANGQLSPIATGSATGRRRIDKAALGGPLGLRDAYRGFLAGADAPEIAGDNAADAPGVMFALWRGNDYDAGGATDSWHLLSSAMVAPAVMPDNFTPGAVRVVLPNTSFSPGVALRVWVAKDYFSSIPTDVLTNHALYDARGDIDGWRLAGSVSTGGAAKFDLAADEIASRYLTIIVSAYLAPDAADLTTPGWQGISGEIIPDISII